MEMDKITAKKRNAAITTSKEELDLLLFNRGQE
jgi:hypothetical protein